MGGEHGPNHVRARRKPAEVDGCPEISGSVALAMHASMSPAVHLVLAIIGGMAVGLFTALLRYGGFVTFIVSTGFALILRIIRLPAIGFVASGGGVGLLLVILGMSVSLAIWAHERVANTSR